MRERERLKNVGLSLGGLHNKTKRVIGQIYPIQRFGIGDQLEKKSGMKGIVVARDGDMTKVRWDSGQLDTIEHGGDTFYQFLREAPPR
jgi:hypothetical protein